MIHKTHDINRLMRNVNTSCLNNVSGMFRYTSLIFYISDEIEFPIEESVNFADIILDELEETIE